MLVPRARHDEAVELAKAQLAKLTLGDPFDQNTRLGPLASAGQRDSVLEFIEQGKKEGATLVAGGGRPAEPAKGFYVEPTIFANVDNKMGIAQEEIFGAFGIELSTCRIGKNPRDKWRVEERDA